MSTIETLSRGHSLTRGLVWKESRQIIPLVVGLFATSLILMLFWSLLSATSRTAEVSGKFLPMILPTLFAVGAAAVLVGQEKEQKTLWWLASFPASATRIVLTKIAVGLGGLFAMWVACFVLMFVSAMTIRNVEILSTIFGSDSFFGGIALPIDHLFLILHSVFILLCGFYTAWKFENTLHSLLAIIPIAAIPFLLVQAGYAVRMMMTGLRWVSLESSAIATMAVTASAIAVSGWMAYRSGVLALAPTAAPDVSPNTQSFLRPWRRHASSTAGLAPQHAFHFDASSIIWQMLRHQRGVLCACFALMMIPLGWLLSQYPFAMHEMWMGPRLAASTIAFGGACLLGVSVFAGSGSSQRVRFLSERGVSPLKVWLCRNGVALSMLSTVLLMYAWYSTVQINNTPRSQSAMPSMATVGLLGLTAFSISQWISHSLRTLVASVLVAPVVAASVLWWLFIAATELGAPLWLLVLLTAVPLAATLLTMHPFMDGRRSTLSWVISAIAILMMVVLPAAPLVARVAGSRTMPQSVCQELLPQAKLAWKESVKPQPFNISLFDDAGRYPSSVNAAVAANRLVLDDTLRTATESFKRDLEESDQPISLEGFALQTLLGGASYAAMELDSAPDDAAVKARLVQWINTLAVVAKRLRHSRDLSDQSSADAIEIWLTYQLLQDSSAAIVRELDTDPAIALLTDQDFRNQSRRKSVLATWYRWLTLGGANRGATLDRVDSMLASGSSRPSLESSLTQHRRRNRLIHALIQMIDAGSAGRSTEPARRELHDHLLDADIRFEDGPYGDRMRVSGDGQHGIGGLLTDQISQFVATQWHAKWETDAMRLTLHTKSKSRDTQ